MQTLASYAHYADGGLLFQLGEREMCGNLNIAEPGTRQQVQQAILDLQNTYIRIRTGALMLPSLPHPAPPPAAAVGGTKMPAKPMQSTVHASPPRATTGRTVRLSAREQMLLSAQQAAEALANTNRPPAWAASAAAANLARRNNDSSTDAAGGRRLPGGGAVLGPSTASFPTVADEVRQQVLEGLARLGELRHTYDDAARYTAKEGEGRGQRSMTILF